MLPGPIFLHELRLVARRKRSYALRVLLGLFLLYSVVMTYESWTASHLRSIQARELSPNEMARLGSNLFGAVVWLQGIVILFLTPAFLAGAIAEDRQRKVLSYLLASPLTGAEIVLGKLAARVMNLAMLISVGLPVVSLALLFGGIEPQAVWLAYAASFSTLYFLSGLSIFLSVYSPRPRDSILLAYVTIVAWLCLPAFEFLLIQIGGPLARLLVDARPITEWITTTSPVSLLSRGAFPSPGQFLEWTSWMIGLQVLYGTLLLGWATIRLRPYESEARPWGLRMFGPARRVQPRRLLKRRACGDEPMIWKECTGTLSVDGPIKAAMFLLLAVAAVGGLGYLFWELGVPSFRESWEYGTGGEGTWVARRFLNFSIRTITAIVYVLTGLMLGASAATGITIEHEKDTWISLVSTPLDCVEIVKAKVLGAFWRVRTPLAALVSVWVMGMCCGAVHPFGVITAAVATAIYSLFIAILGTYVSLRFKSSARAIATTIAVLVFLNGGYLFCCLPLIEGTDVVLVLAGFTPMIVTYAPFSARELESFFSMSHSGSMDSRASAIATAFLSFGLYSSAAFVLWQACLHQFERAVDRPRRLVPPYPSHPDLTGITFVDEGDLDPSTVRGDDLAGPASRP